MLSFIGIRAATPLHPQSQTHHASSLVPALSSLSLASPRSYRSPSPVANVHHDDVEATDESSGDEKCRNEKGVKGLPLGSVDINKLTTSAKRRARKNKLEAAWEEGRVVKETKEIEHEGEEELQRRRMRRGGRKLRGRKETAMVRRLLDVEATEASGDEWAEQAENRILDGAPDLQDEDEVEDLAVLEVESESEPEVEAERMTFERAKDCIDRYFAGEPGFIDRPENKLLLWQSLCIELGISDPDSTERPLPATLSSARALLKERAHINLHDYIDARKMDLGSYAHLVHPSASSVRRYTQQRQRAADLSLAKKEWLDPLLRDFGYRRTKRS